MRLRLVVILLLITALASASQVQAPHVAVEYDGITLPQATAIANTVSTAWIVLVDEFKMPMPESIAVTVSTAIQTKLTSGCKKGNNSICLELATPRHLDPPSRSGYFQLYGMCHELGHIAWQTNMHGLYIFTSDGDEGWAHYIGSILVDRLYDLKGPSLWFEEYDYRADGTARLRKSLTGNPSDSNRAAGAFLRLEEIVGRQRIAKLFPPLWEATRSLSHGISAAVENTLVSTFEDQAESLRTWWRSNSALLTEAGAGARQD